MFKAMRLQVLPGGIVIGHVIPKENPANGLYDPFKENMVYEYTIDPVYGNDTFKRIGEADFKQQDANGGIDKLLAVSGGKHLTVEALEARDKQIAELTEARDLFNSKMMGFAYRVEELEARTVKLPQRLQPGADGYDDWYVHSAADGEYLKADDVIAALAAAGVAVEGVNND